MSVSGHPEPVASRFVDNGLELLVAQLLGADWSLEGEHAGGGAHLDDLSAVLDLVPDRLDDGPGAIRNAVLGAPLCDPRSEPSHIAVATGDSDRVAGRHHMGPHRDAAFDCFAKGNRDVTPNIGGPW